MPMPFFGDLVVDDPLAASRAGYPSTQLAILAAAAVVAGEVPYLCVGLFLACDAEAHAGHRAVRALRRASAYRLTVMLV